MPSNHPRRPFPPDRSKAPTRVTTIAARHRTNQQEHRIPMYMRTASQGQETQYIPHKNYHIEETQGAKIQTTAVLGCVLRHRLTFLGAALGAAFALGATAGLDDAAGRPPEDFLAATGPPDDFEAFTTMGEEAAWSDRVSGTSNTNRFGELIWCSKLSAIFGASQTGLKPARPPPSTRDPFDWKKIRPDLTIAFKSSPSTNGSK